MDGHEKENEKLLTYSTFPASLITAALRPSSRSKFRIQGKTCTRDNPIMEEKVMQEHKKGSLRFTCLSRCNSVLLGDRIICIALGRFVARGFRVCNDLTIQRTLIHGYCRSIFRPKEKKKGKTQAIVAA